jgi:hypothetical protein
MTFFRGLLTGARRARKREYPEGFRRALKNAFLEGYHG